MVTSPTLGLLLEDRYKSAFFTEVNRTHLFDNVYWYKPHWSASGLVIYNHACGSRGGKYRILKKGTCAKCKKMIGSYKKLDTIRGLKELTSTVIKEPFHWIPGGDGSYHPSGKPIK